MPDSFEWKSTIVANDELGSYVRQSAEIKTDEQAREAARFLGEDTFWPTIEGYADECDKVLTDSGFPRAMESVRHDGKGNWWRHPAGEPTSPALGETWNFVLGFKLVQEHAKPFSDEWFAARIGFRCWEALHQHKRGRSGEPDVLVTIFDIATLRTEWRWRSTRKSDVLRGKKVRASASVGGKETARSSRTKSGKTLKAMTTYVDNGMTVANAARLAHTKDGHGTSPAANKRMWSRYHQRK